MACGRIQIASNKKAALLKQSMREVAVMLAEEPPREEKARIRAEALIRDDHLIEAYEILQLECELLHERIKLIQYCKSCPHDLISVISTLIWASHRVDIPELGLIRKMDWKPDEVEVTMILTTPFCPYGPAMIEQVRNKSQETVERTTKVTMGLEMWEPTMMEDQAAANWGLYY